MLRGQYVCVLGGGSYGGKQEEQPAKNSMFSELGLIRNILL